MRAYIAGIGSYAPERIVTNVDMEKIVDTSDEWIRTRSGIRERRYIAPEQASSDMAEIAAKRALEHGGVAPGDIQVVIAATITPDMPFPATACLLQTRLGIPEVMSFDLAAGCSGFLYALGVGDLFVRGGYDNVLVIGVETLTRIVDFKDRGTCVLFGDGAGAVVLKRTDADDRGIMSSYFAADGSNWELLYQPAGGSRLPASHETVEKNLHVVKMKGNEVFKIAVQSMGEAAVETLKRANAKSEDVSLLITHQANIRIIEATARRVNIPPERVFINIDKYGNTSSASIPLALDEAVRSGRVHTGDNILLVAFGAGFTWGGVLVRW